MEEKVFPSPAVAGVLREHYVEARLHTDGGKSLEANLKLQRELAEVVTTPFYIALDPRSRSKLATFEGGGLSRAEDFLAFLRKGAAAVPGRAGRTD